MIDGIWHHFRSNGEPFFRDLEHAITRSENFILLDRSWIYEKVQDMGKTRLRATSHCRKWAILTGLVCLSELDSELDGFREVKTLRTPEIDIPC